MTNLNADQVTPGQRVRITRKRFNPGTGPAVGTEVLVLAQTYDGSGPITAPAPDEQGDWIGVHVPDERTNQCWALVEAVDAVAEPTRAVIRRNGRDLFVGQIIVGRQTRNEYEILPADHERYATLGASTDRVVVRRLTGAQVGTIADIGAWSFDVTDRFAAPTVDVPDTPHVYAVGDRIRRSTPEHYASDRIRDTHDYEQRESVVGQPGEVISVFDDYLRVRWDEFQGRESRTSAISRRNVEYVPAGATTARRDSRWTPEQERAIVDAVASAAQTHRACAVAAEALRALGIEQPQKTEKVRLTLELEVDVRSTSGTVQLPASIPARYMSGFVDASTLNALVDRMIASERVLTRSGDATLKVTDLTRNV